MARDQVFISYSRKDKDWLERLQTMLVPLTRAGFKIWADTDIKPGEEWKKVIEEALTHTKVAVLLVSPDFLASRFIHENELPPLLDAAQNAGLTILWVLVRPCYYKPTIIAKYQAALSPPSPLSGMGRAKREKALVSIVEKIEEALSATPIIPVDSAGKIVCAAEAVIVPPPETLPAIQNIRDVSATQVQVLQQQTAQLLKVAVEFRDTLKDGSPGPEMVVIPAGEFLMGSPESESERQNNEGPQHKVVIAKPFAMGRYAATFEEYDRFCKAIGQEQPDDEGWGRSRHPVINATNPFHHIGPFVGDQAVQRISPIESIQKYLLRQEYVALLAPRQSGKTSFLAQLEVYLVKQNRKICRLDLKTIGDDFLLVKLFAHTMQQESKKNPKDLLELFNNKCGAIVFLIDELPRDVHMAVSLLRSVRAYFNEAKVSNLKKDTMHLFVFTGSVDLTSLAVGHVSPFNIAQEVYLPDFTLEETRSLLQNLVANEDKTVIFDTPTIDHIYELTCGHPYLTQYLCYRIYDSPQNRDEILAGPEQAIRLCGIENSVNVQSMVNSLWSGKDTQEELRLLRFILEGRSVRFMTSVRALKNLQLQGCIKNNEGWCALRNPIYELIFKNRFSMQDVVGMGLASGTETSGRPNVIPDRNTRFAKIGQFHGIIQIEIIGAEGKVPFLTSGNKQIKDGFFTVHWTQDYKLVLKLIELAEVTEVSPKLSETTFVEDLVVDGVDLSSQWVRYSVVPECFSIGFSAGEVGLTFAPRQQGELIRGEYSFRFRTPSPTGPSFTDPSQEPRSEEAHIYLSLYQETALIQVTAIKLLLVP